MKNFEKYRLIVGILLFMLSFSAVFYLGSEESFRKAEEDVLSDILNWNYQVSRSFAYREHPEIVENVAEGLRVRTQLQSFEFTVGGAVRYSWPGDATVNVEGENCHPVTQALSLDGGARIGFFRGCLPKRQIYLKTLFSNLVLGLFFIFGILMMLANSLPLSMYKRVLLKFVDSLTVWASNNGKSDLKEDVGDDEIAKKMAGLVEAGVRSKTELEKVQLQLDAQEVFEETAGQAAHDIKGPITDLKELHERF